MKKIEIYQKATYLAVLLVLPAHEMLEKQPYLIIRKVKTCQESTLLLLGMKCLKSSGI